MSRHRGLIIVVALYLLANALIWVFADAEARLGEAADGGSWFRPALALMKHGAFVDLDDPTKVDTYRPPLYPLFEAAAMKAAGGPSPSAIALAQIALLLLVGLLFRDLVRDWFPGWEDFGMALLLFNPSVLSSAQFVQSEILFLACTMLTFWAAAKFARGHGYWRYALLSGLGVALACLTRPTAQFLIFALPAVFPFVAEKSRRRIAVLQGVGAFAFAATLMAPWVYVVASQGHGLALSDSNGKYRFVWDQVVMIEAQSKGLSYHKAEEKLTSPGGAEYDYVSQHREELEAMSIPQRNLTLAREGMAILVSYPASDFLKTLFRSQAQFFLAGGAGNWHNLFDLGKESVSEGWFTTAQDDLWGLLAQLFGDLPPAGLAFSAIAIGFTIAARLLGLVGLTAFFDRDRRGLLLIVLGLVAYFAFIHVFVGNSRYRIAVEPMLMLLTLAGIVQIRDRLQRR